MNREFAILNCNDSCQALVKSTVEVLSKSFVGDQITVYTKTAVDSFNDPSIKCRNAVIPAELTTGSKIRNWVNAEAKSAGSSRFLHVIEDTTKLNEDPTQFVEDIERMMDVLDYSVWMSTVTDGCNYVYKKYNPRFTIDIDDPKYQKFGINQIHCTSHSNTCWMIYDMEKVSDDLLKFNDSFSVPMYYIIEFLARRRNTKPTGSLYFMNQYLTIKSEYKVFESVPCEGGEPVEKNMPAEDKIFKSLSVNNAPDNSVDQVLIALYDKLNSKMTT